MAWSAYTYNSLNGYCGNCSIVLSSKIHVMIENKKVITWSLVILFLILMIVYSLTYQKKQFLFKISREIWSGDMSQILQQNIWLWEKIDKENLENEKLWEMVGSVSLWGLQSNVENDLDIQGAVWESNFVSLGSDNVNVLSGTSEYFGTLDIVSILGQKPKYTLQDSKWNYFVYYWSHLDFIKTIQTLWWNVYEMVTESEIIQNQLFGDRVTYINLSMFKDVRVLMVIEIDGEVRLLQIPADKYHYSKDYLKSLFIQ